MRLVEGTAAASTVPDSSCDVVLLANVWHELDDHADVLRECARILRSGGRVAILDWRADIDSPPGPPREHRIGESPVRALLLASGWRAEHPALAVQLSHHWRKGILNMNVRHLMLATVAVALTSCATASHTTATSHRIVMEVSSDNPAVWDAALNNAQNLKKSLGDATAIEMVAHGGGLGMLLLTNTAQSERLQKLTASGIVFAACENTMRKKNVTGADLLPFATTVDSGVAEVVRKQEEGWSYVKSGS